MRVIKFYGRRNVGFRPELSFMNTVNLMHVRENFCGKIMMSEQWLIVEFTELHSVVLILQGDWRM